MKNNKAFTLIELLVVLAIVAILCSMVLGAVGGCAVADGKRAGVLQRFTYTGQWHKSYEGELQLGGAQAKAGYGVGNVVDFSVTDPNVAAKLQNLLGQEIIITYHQTKFHNPMQVNTSCLVTDVSTNN